MKNLFVFLVLLFCTSFAQAQTKYYISPVITEPCDTIIYHQHGMTIAIYKFKDNSGAYIQQLDGSGVVYYSKREYKKWKKRKGIKL